ncbi:MAG: hypothetical protein BA866_10565 [Desulfobulbaceae bacterium S5133MH15]|nr:MAG: hypothetical protein BA866_10565 [Desulfobulbaceae bacterium S5133MH15]
MRVKSLQALQAWFIAVGICSLSFSSVSIAACELATTVKDAAPGEIKTFFESKKKAVVTFVGYSGAEYEDNAALLEKAESVLVEFDPSKTLVNIGATPEGIGAIYELAKKKGFITTGIVSTQAKEYDAKLSTCVNYVFYVKDATWGGFTEGSDRLSPTSTAMVENSDILIGIGGGSVARDELTAAKRLGKEVRFIPADMNHQKAREKAKKKGLLAPTSFGGTADEVF